MNNGQRYEKELADLFGVSNAGGSDTAPDLMIEGVGIEVKNTLGAAFGSVSLTHKSGVWDITSRVRSKVLAGAVRDSPIINRINGEWNTDTDVHQQVVVSIDSRIARQYYRRKECAYLQIKTHGLFRLGRLNPWNLEVPMFNPKKVTLRARRNAPKGGGRTANFICINCSNSQHSSMNLEELA
jgi:hypothetical protein